MWLLYVQLLGGRTDTRCVSRCDQSAQNRRQKVFTKVVLRLSRLGIENLLKSPLIYSVSYFNLGPLGFCLDPVATGLNPPELPISDEARNDSHIASTGVKLH